MLWFILLVTVVLVRATARFGGWPLLFWIAFVLAAYLAGVRGVTIERVEAPAAAGA